MFDLRFDLLDRPGPQTRLLVLLHGYGLLVDELTDRLDLLDPDGQFAVVAPVAPFEKRGQAHWHRGLSKPDEAREQYGASLESIDRLLGHVEAEFGFAASDAVVGGFSQGGGLAFGLLLGADVRHRPAAAFGVCSFPPSFAGFRVDAAAAAGRPCLLISAHQDHFAPIESSRAGAALLRDTGLDLTYAETDGGHVMTDEAAATVGTWLASPAAVDERGSLLLAGAPRSSYGDLWEHVT